VPAERVPTRKLIGDDDDIPNDTDLIELSKDSLKKRLGRHTAKELRERFGTDSFEEIGGKLQKLADFEKKEEATRLAQMTEIDRLKEQLGTKDREGVEWKTKYDELQTTIALNSEGRAIDKVLRKHFDPEYLAIHRVSLANHLLNCTDEELQNRDAVVEKWSKDTVSRFPKFARTFAPPAPADNGQPVVVQSVPAPPPAVSLTTGPDPNNTRPPAGSQQTTNLAGKTPEPGKANSMTDPEYRAWKAQNGIRT